MMSAPLPPMAEDDEEACPPTPPPPRYEDWRWPRPPPSELAPAPVLAPKKAPDALPPIPLKERVAERCIGDTVRLHLLVVLRGSIQHRHDDKAGWWWVMMVGGGC